MLDHLSGAELALESYVRRAKQGAEDAALLAGTGKDLVEATAAHVLNQIYGHYPSTINFPALLGQAFAALGLAVEKKDGQSAHDRMDAALFELACSINMLRNKQGTGHGRPFLPTLSVAEARTAIESRGIIAERLLTALKMSR